MLPLKLFLKGGPGGASSVPVLYELGPCSVLPGGEGTRLNHYSWNSEANVSSSTA